MRYSDAELDAFEAIFENAAWACESDQAHIDLVLLMDTDRTVETALFERQQVAEDKRRAALTDEQRAAEDAQSAQLVEIGMRRVREVLASHRARS